MDISELIKAVADIFGNASGKKKIGLLLVGVIAALVVFAALSGVMTERARENEDSSGAGLVIYEESSEEEKTGEPEVTSADGESSEEETTTAAPETTTSEKVTTTSETAAAEEYVEYRFRTQKLLDQHYEKHGIDMGFESAEEYEGAASDVVNDPTALHKTEKEDGDDIYYVEATNEFVVVSTDGYIRTYFYPDKGKAYYDKQ